MEEHRILETAEQIKALPACRVTIERSSPCSLLLTTSEGKKLYLGSPGASAEVAAFLNTLRSGQTYELPAAFLAWQKTK